MLRMEFTAASLSPVTSSRFKRKSSGKFVGHDNLVMEKELRPSRPRCSSGSLTPYDLEQAVRVLTVTRAQGCWWCFPSP